MKNLLLMLALFLMSCSDDSESDYLSLDVSTNLLITMNYEVTQSNDSIVHLIKWAHPELDSIRIIRIKLIEALNSRISNLIMYCGGVDVNGMLVDPYAKPMVKSYLLEQNEANVMQAEINNLIKKTDKFGVAVWRPIRDAADIEIFKNDPYQRDKTFAILNFADRNLYQVVNTFEQLKLSILVSEQTFIAEYLAKKQCQ